MRLAVAGGTGLAGRYVVEAAEASGHDVIPLARSAGVNTQTGEGLADALAGVDIIIDTTNSPTTEQGPATDFFVESTTNLAHLGAEAGVRHLVVLSIVGIDKVPTGYYAAKLAQETAALEGPVAATIVRTTQFHEFAAQVIRWNRKGAVAKIPNVRTRTVAARTVGVVLVRDAVTRPAGRAADLGGPAEADLVDLARRFATQFGLAVDIVPAESEVPDRVWIPSDGARFEGPAFSTWLLSDDAALLGRA